jgi:hypothetical protein
VEVEQSEKKREGVKQVALMFALPMEGDGVTACPDPKAQLFAFLPVGPYGFRCVAAGCRPQRSALCTGSELVVLIVRFSVCLLVLLATIIYRQPGRCPASGVMRLASAIMAPVLSAMQPLPAWVLFLES